MVRRLLTLALAALVLLAGCAGFEDPAFTDEPTRERTARPTRTAEEETEEPTEETEEPTEETEEPTEETEEPTEETEEPEETRGPELSGELPDGTILYLAEDGVTIKAVSPDGREEETAYTIPNKTADDVVTGIYIDSEGDYLVYGLNNDPEGWFYYLVKDADEEPRLLEWLGGAPQWSPDGERFVAVGLTEDRSFGNIVIYDPDSDQRQELDAFGTPSWAPDGNGLVYVSFDEAGIGEIFTYDLASKESTQLTNFGEQGQEWSIDEAHYMVDPDGGQNIIFYGGPRDELGASGNGMRWWSIPTTGGEEPEPYSDPSGSGIVAFEASDEHTWVAYGDHVSGLGCRGGQNLTVSAAGLGGGIAMSPPSPEFGAPNEDELPRLVEVKGLSWGSDQHLAYGVQVTECSEEDLEPTGASDQSIWIWDVSSGNGTDDPLLIRIASGSYPVWVR